eukprot:1145469-Pelagomonas_calceolata.AAC.3
MSNPFTQAPLSLGKDAAPGVRMTGEQQISCASGIEGAGAASSKHVCMLPESWISSSPLRQLPLARRVLLRLYICLIERPFIPTYSDRMRQRPAGCKRSKHAPYAHTSASAPGGHTSESGAMGGASSPRYPEPASGSLLTMRSTEKRHRGWRDWGQCKVPNATVGNGQHREGALWMERWEAIRYLRHLE